MTKANAHYVDCDINPDTGSWTCVPTSGSTPQYPTLQELATADIPTKPTAPTLSAQSSPTEVSDYTGLQAVTGSGDYILTSNIDLTGETWTPITNFSGTLNGAGYAISNLTLSNSSDNQGLFANLNSGAEIYNLTLNSFSMSCGDYVGALAGKIDEQGDIIIKDVSVTSPVITGGTCIGGLLGLVDSTGGIEVNDCSVSSPTLTSTPAAYNSISRLGGMFGCYATEGDDAEDDITDSYVSGGTITGHRRVGGMFGEVDSTSDDLITIHTCYATADLRTNKPGAGTGNYRFGGFIGYCLGADIITCYSTGDITQVEDEMDILAFGGFSGEFQASNLTTAPKIINCYSTGSITLTSPASGGETFEEIGGFTGKVWTTHTLLRCYSTGDIAINNYPATEDSDSDQIYWVGGFAGSIQLTNALGYIKRCWTETNIHITTFYTAAEIGVGGFVGGITNAHTEEYPIENCYCWTSITADRAQPGGGKDVYICGGFCGGTDSNSSSDLACTNCYAAQTETKYGSGLTAQLFDGGTDEVGGFCGLDSSAGGDVTATASYWDTATSSITADDSDGAVGHITAWMQTKANYTAASWDFDDIWYMPDVTDYPVQKRAIWYQEDYSHIEGETVQVLGDGEFLGTDTVSSGAITLDDNTTVNHVGIGYTSKVQPMKVDGEVYYKSIKDFYLQMYETLNGKYGETLSTLYSIPYGDTDLYTGHKELPFEGSYNRSGDMWVTQSDPLPMTILGIVIKAFYSDGSS